LAEADRQNDQGAMFFTCPEDARWSAESQSVKFRVGIPGSEEIRAKVSARTFGNSVIQNDFRGLAAETIVETALGASWQCCSGDWRGRDFEHRDGPGLK
jgi:hypothetical protein